MADLLAVWRVHGLDRIVRRAWESGVVLSGVGAGSLCWFEGGTTDSSGPELRPLTDALGFLPDGNGGHYDSDPGRRPLVYRATELFEAVTEVPGKGAYLVTRDGDRTGEERVEPRRLPGV